MRVSNEVLNNAITKGFYFTPGINHFEALEDLQDARREIDTLYASLRDTTESLERFAGAFDWLRDRLQECSVSVSDEIGLPRGWTDLLDAIRAAIAKAKGEQ